MSLVICTLPLIIFEYDASRLEVNKRKQSAKTRRHIAKARGYFFPFFARVHLGNDGEYII